MVVTQIRTLDELNRMTQCQSCPWSNYGVIVMFSSKRCGPCQMMAPYFEQLSQSNPQIKFLKVDVDESSSLGQMFNIKGIPAFIVYKRGIQKKEFCGANKNKLAESVSYLNMQTY